MFNNSTEKSFVDACLNGHAFLEDVDDWVEHWHTSDDVPAELQTFLGLDDTEYALWVEQPESLQFAIAAHRHNQPVTALMTSQRDYALAARADNPEAASHLVSWLARTGRIDDDFKPA